MAGTDALTLEEVAARSGEAVADVAGWREAGLLGAGGAIGPQAAERARLVGYLVRRGFDVETIARADRQQLDLLGRFVDYLYPSGRLPPTYSVAELARRTGLDSGFVRRLWDVAGLSESGEPAGDEDVDMLCGFADALALGLPQDAVMQLAEVWADSLRRVAEAEVRLFHFYVHERLRGQGLAGEDFLAAQDAARARLQELIDPALRYFHGKGWASALHDDLALHVSQHDLSGPVPREPGTLSAAVLFVDLSRFTPFTETRGDAAAAEVVELFASMVRSAAARGHGRVVKQIGDAFMVVFLDPRAAVQCALAIEEQASEQRSFPAVRSGAHSGTVLYRQGDYVGATVNIAARLAAEAHDHQVLVTADLHQATGALPAVEFVPVGYRDLKGVSHAVEIFDVRRRPAASTERFVDPVCGMELTAAEIAARLDVAGQTLAFCSTPCLQRYVANPTTDRDTIYGEHA